jgi:hypothetical protein
MPLIVFSVNTLHDTVGESQALAMEDDGTFRLTHQFVEPPPVDTEYFIKHVYINSSGQRGGDQGRNKEPTLWAALDFPQLTDEIVSTDNNAKSAEYNGKVHSVDGGVLRFPVTTYPITGRKNNIGVDSNKPGRASADAFASFYVHRGTHVCNIPLGRMSVEDNRIDCIFRPFARLGRQLVDSDDAGGDLWPRIRNLQVILEYK